MALWPAKKRHFPPFAITFLTVFSGFFCALSHQGRKMAQIQPRKALVLNHAQSRHGSNGRHPRERSRQ